MTNDSRTSTGQVFRPMARSTITTRYYGATNFRGARIKAWAPGLPAVWISYPHDATEGEQAHALAAMKLATRYHWRGVWHVGSNGNGFTFVLVDSGTAAFAVTMEARS